MPRKGKILIIEDEKEWQDLLSEYLESAEFQIEIADNLDLAIEKINNELFHYITIDLRLTGDKDASSYEGWDILRTAIKQRIMYRTPYMVITGYDKEYLELKGIKGLAGVHFMPKSNFNKQVFLDTIISSVEKINLHFFNDNRDGIQNDKK